MVNTITTTWLSLWCQCISDRNAGYHNSRPDGVLMMNGDGRILDTIVIQGTLDGQNVQEEDTRLSGISEEPPYSHTPLMYSFLLHTSFHY